MSKPSSSISPRSPGGSQSSSSAGSPPSSAPAPGPLLRVLIDFALGAGRDARYRLPDISPSVLANEVAHGVLNGLPLLDFLVENPWLGDIAPVISARTPGGLLREVVFDILYREAVVGMEEEELRPVRDDWAAPVPAGGRPAPAICSEEHSQEWH
jgi:hypothetical protein